LASNGANGKHYVARLSAGATLAEIADIATINLRGTDTLTIDGGGATLDGGGLHRGFFVYAGDVTIKNLTVENQLAHGGDASGEDGGGGAGFGGGLFVANDAAGGAAPSRVTLSN